MKEVFESLKAAMAEMDSVVVAYSGGVDSALVARAAYDALGDRSIAMIGVSATLPPEELEEARQVAEEAGFPLIEVEARELEVEGYAANAGNRCYFCKTELFGLAEREREARGFRWVADGTLVDDLGDHRPGLQAASEQRVRHPLVEIGLRKAEVRDLARWLGLSVWDKPSFACLGSRFPAGTRVSLEKVQRVQRAESALRAMGLRQFRVRWHEMDGGVLARVEVEPADIPRLLDGERRTELVTRLKEVGFRWVTLDLAGYTAPALLAASGAPST